MCVLRCSGEINIKLLVMRDFAYKMDKGLGTEKSLLQASGQAVFLE